MNASLSALHVTFPFFHSFGNIFLKEIRNKNVGFRKLLARIHVPERQGSKNAPGGVGKAYNFRLRQKQ